MLDITESQGGGARSERRLLQKLSFFRNDDFKNPPLKYITAKRGFSVAEAMIALLVFSIILGLSAPLMTKTQKNSLPSPPVVVNGVEIPTGAIMFFETATCPDGWDPVVTRENGLSGYYPRLAGEKDAEIGTTKEQMVHRHKHVAPNPHVIDDSAAVNYHRYGPFRNRHSYADGIFGDNNYPIMSVNYNSNINYDLDAGTDQLLRGGNYGADDLNNWYAYTSDGMNRYEQIATYAGVKAPILTCPNRDEEGLCKDKKGGNSFTFTNGAKNTITINNLPYLADMPLVGNENRPNSVIWLACKKLPPKT